MKFLIDLISEQLAGAFERAGFDAAYGKATLSNRPDLCEYQCNGALAAAKQYHKAPIQIANAVLEALGENEMFSSAEAVMPGFLNLKISEDYLASYLREMAQTPHYGAQDDPNACTIVLDYGGPNVAKPLHVASAQRHHRRIAQAHLPVLRQSCDRRYPSGRLGIADGPDHGAAAG